MQTASFLFAMTTLLEIFANAGAAMPIIIALGLIAGRRGNGIMCMEGNLLFSRIAITCALAIPFYYLAAFLDQISAFPESSASIADTLFSLPGAPWSTSIIASIAGCVLVCWGCAALQAAQPLETYVFAHIKKPVLFFLAASFCFLATFILSSWPFAGLPEGMGWGRACLAVFRNGARHYFVALCPAGAIALVAAAWFAQKGRFGQAAGDIAIRWCAMWAATGYIPWAIQAWGIAIGLSMRGGQTSGLALQIVSLSFLSLAILCWGWLFFRKKPALILAITAFCLLLFKQFTPLLAKLI